MAVLVEDRVHVRIVTIDRPERRNALDPETKADLLATALEVAGRIVANGPLAVRISKEIVFDARDLLGVDMAALRENASVVSRSADAQEGARAFAEKRPPVWTGR
jgi:enoyl-CoA hydratase